MPVDSGRSITIDWHTHRTTYTMGDGQVVRVDGRAGPEEYTVVELQRWLHSSDGLRHPRRQRKQLLWWLDGHAQQHLTGGTAS